MSAEVNSNGSLIRSYQWGVGIDDLLAMSVYTGATAKTYFAIKDHIGTVVAMADETGQIVESYDLDAWGKVLAVRDASGNAIAESGIGNRHLLHGREYSWKTGFYQYRYREYDCISGRFLSKDPIGVAGGMNEWEFCNNSPQSYVDPLGLEKFEEPTSLFDDIVAIMGIARKIGETINPPETMPFVGPDGKTRQIPVYNGALPGPPGMDTFARAKRLLGISKKAPTLERAFSRNKAIDKIVRGVEKGLAPSDEIMAPDRKGAYWLRIIEKILGLF